MSIPGTYSVNTKYLSCKYQAIRGIAIEFYSKKNMQLFWALVFSTMLRWEIQKQEGNSAAAASEPPESFGIGQEVLYFIFTFIAVPSHLHSLLWWWCCYFWLEPSFAANDRSETETSLLHFNCTVVLSFECFVHERGVCSLLRLLSWVYCVL